MLFSVMPGKNPLVKSTYKATKASTKATKDMMLGIPQSTQTDDRTKNENKQEALGFFAAGKCTPGDGKITIKCWEKPVCDVDVYWEVK